MPPYLPDEFPLEIAKCVVSQPALAALSQASKRFYRIFSPFLYRDFWALDRYTLDLLGFILPDSHCSSVRSLTIAHHAFHAFP